MHHNIPIAVLIVMSMLNRYVYENVRCKEVSESGIIVVYVIISVMNFIWVTVRSRHDFLINYPETGSKWKKYAFYQCMISILSLYSLNYYVNKGVPFNCFFAYNETLAETLFYLTFGIITTLSYIEHSVWKKLGSELLSDDERAQ